LVVAKTWKFSKCLSFCYVRAQSGSSSSKSILTNHPVHPQYPILLTPAPEKYLTPSSLKRWHHSEVLRRPLLFPSDDPLLFQTFINFLRTGELRHPNLLETATSSSFLAFLCSLFGFAAEYNAFSLRNTILDTFFLVIYDTGRIPFENVGDVYEAAKEGSSFRDLVVHTTINIGSKKELDDWEDELPPAFLADCRDMARDDGVVAFSADSDEWLEEKRRSMCMHYHVHEREEDEDGFEVYMDMSPAAVQQRREEAQAATDRELGFIKEMRRNAVRY
jgi:hypothetical protein